MFFSTLRPYALAFTLTLSTAAAGLASGELAPGAPEFEVVALGGGVAFTTDFDYGKSYLRVVGPQGFVTEQTFSELDDLFFSFDSAPADGIYNWEMLSVSPISQSVRNRLEAAKASGDDDLVYRLKETGAIASFTFFGTFQVRGGILHTPTENASSDDRDLSLKDQLFSQDVIVDGSLCTGLDCSDGEDFDFDTIRLKENNLRIHFEDTSTSGSFPSNDWRLKANDTSNGGANYFAIQDATAENDVFRVDAGAPDNSLYLDSSGRAGFGTSSPSLDLHVVSGNVPALRLEQDASGGFTPYRWDIAGNEANFYVRNVDGGGGLPFRIKDGAGGNSLVLDDDGNLCLGCHNAQDNAIRHSNGAVLTAGGTWTNASSRRLKEDIRVIEADAALAALNQLEPVTFRYKAERDEIYAGFIAEDVPELVAMKDRKSLTSMDVVAVLTKALQEMHKKVDALEARLAGLDVE